MSEEEKGLVREHADKRIENFIHVLLHIAIRNNKWVYYENTTIGHETTRCSALTQNNKYRE